VYINKNERSDHHKIYLPETFKKKPTKLIYSQPNSFNKITAVHREKASSVHNIVFAKKYAPSPTHHNRNMWCEHVIYILFQYNPTVDTFRLLKWKLRIYIYGNKIVTTSRGYHSSRQNCFAFSQPSRPKTSSSELGWQGFPTCISSFCCSEPFGQHFTWYYKIHGEAMRQWS
jgi:hypothetical protein